MTGPEHYTVAEMLLDMAGDDDGGSDTERYHVAAAQVHATLAQTAALIDRSSISGARLSVEWEKAVGEG